MAFFFHVRPNMSAFITSNASNDSTPHFIEESDEMPLLGLDYALVEIYQLHKEKENGNPYNTTKIANMWKALWPPSLQRLCKEVEMDGWDAVPRELLNVTKNSIAEIIEIISSSGYPGADKFVNKVSDIGMIRRIIHRIIPRRVCHSTTNKIVLKSGRKTSIKSVVFWSCSIDSLWNSRLHLTCGVVAIF